MKLTRVGPKEPRIRWVPAYTRGRATFYSILGRPTVDVLQVIVFRNAAARACARSTIIELKGKFDSACVTVSFEQNDLWQSVPFFKGKVFPYSLPSVGPGADPGVQAFSPQVT